MQAKVGLARARADEAGSPAAGDAIIAEAQVDDHRVAERSGKWS